jgi:signal transduction histidine kinase
VTGARAVVRILHLEDDAADAALIAHALRAELPDVELRHVTGGEAYRRALGAGPWDLVLSDYSLPGYSGLQAAEELGRTADDVPFILVTGTIGDEGAAAALRAGVTDYVLKDRLERLGPAVHRALDEARERRRNLELEELLRQAQKMEAVGQLTGGIAHDFNNILTIMMASAELVAMGLRPDQGELREDLQALVHAGERGKEMIRKLLGFSRRQPLEPRPLDVNLVVGGVADTLKRLLPATITVQRELQRGLPAMRADAGSIEQMVLNLATNARDAMPEGGTLTISTAAAPADDPALARRGETGGRYIRIAVRDTGAGMPPEVVEHIFEPFFTTKPEGKGTGLGMAMIYGLAQQQKGFVEVTSAVGQGTVVALYLPVAAEAAGPAANDAAPGTRRTSAEFRRPTAATILIADDEAVLRRVMERALVRQGFRVVAAASGGEALELLLALRGEVALVITDQMMPGFGGAEIYREARDRGMTVPFLVTSGYSSDELQAKGFGPEVRRLMKPWTVDDLTAAVNAALSESG